MHIARAQFLAIDAEIAALTTRNPARYFQFGDIVIGCRRQPRRIFQKQHHFRHIAPGARGGTGENHIIHFAAAHRLGRGFAHGPAQRFNHIRFAAAIGPDNAGQPRQHFNRCRFREGFETGDADARKLRRQRGAGLVIAARRFGRFGLRRADFCSFFGRASGDDFFHQRGVASRTAASKRSKGIAPGSFCVPMMKVGVALT